MIGLSLLGGSVRKVTNPTFGGSLRPVKFARKLNAFPADTRRPRSQSLKSEPEDLEITSSREPQLLIHSASDMDAKVRNEAVSIPKQTVRADSESGALATGNTHSIYYDYDSPKEDLGADENLRKRLIKAHGRDDIVLLHSIPVGLSDRDTRLGGRNAPAAASFESDIVQMWSSL